MTVCRAAHTHTSSLLSESCGGVIIMVSCSSPPFQFVQGVFSHLLPLTCKFLVRHLAQSSRRSAWLSLWQGAQ